MVAVTVVVILYEQSYIRIFVENPVPAMSFAGAEALSPTVPEPSSSWCRRGSATIANNSSAGAATSTDLLT
jgi:hypothetical protein